MLAFAPVVPSPIVIPAPSHADESPASAAMLNTKSSIVTVVELTVVVVPLTVKSPVTVKLSATVTSEVLFPIVIGTLDSVPILSPLLLVI